MSAALIAALQAELALAWGAGDLARVAELTKRISEATK